MFFAVWLVLLLGAQIFNGQSLKSKQNLQIVFLTIIYLVCSQVFIILMNEDERYTSKIKNFVEKSSLKKLRLAHSGQKDMSFSSNFNTIMTVYRGILTICMAQNLKVTFQMSHYLA